MGLVNATLGTADSPAPMRMPPIPKNHALTSTFHELAGDAGL